MKIKSTFQHFMLDNSNKLIIDEIISLFHPNIKENITLYHKYDWVCIKSKNISIGIQFETTIDGKPMYGPGWKIKDFIKAHINSKFKAWRFVDDSKYKSPTSIDDIEDKIDINQIMIKHNVPKPSPNEMYMYYYED